MHYTPNWSLWNMILTQISVHTRLPIFEDFQTILNGSIEF
jgi:hypothetical protein